MKTTLTGCSTQQKRHHAPNQLGQNIWIDDQTYQVYIDQTENDPNTPVVILTEKNCAKAQIDLYNPIRDKVSKAKLKNIQASIKTKIHLSEGGCRLVVRYKSTKLREYLNDTINK